MKKIIIIIPVMLSMFLTGCDNISFKDDAVQALQDNELTREDILALMHLEPEHTRSFEEMDEVLRDLMARSKDLERFEITRTEMFSRTFENGFLSERGETQASEIGFFLNILRDPDAREDKQPGFALLSNDIRVGQIIAVISEGDWNDPNEPFFVLIRAGLEGHILDTIETYNRITEEQIRKAQEKLERSINNARISYWGVEFLGSKVAMLNPGITTEWSAGTHNGPQPYSWAIASAFFAPNQLMRNDDFNFMVGRDVIALAQLVAFHERFKNLNIENAPESVITGYVSTNFFGYGNVSEPVSSFRIPAPQGANANTWIDFSSLGQFNWTGMKSFQNANNIADVYKHHVAALVFQIGCKMYKWFEPDDSYGAVRIEFAWNALYEMGYTAGGIQSGRTRDILFSIFGVMRSIDEGFPVYATGTFHDTNLNPPPVAWLIDGYDLANNVYNPLPAQLFYRCIIGNGTGKHLINADILNNSAVNTQYLTGVHFPYNPF